MGGRVSVGVRFGGFAIGHFVVSALGVGIIWWAAAASGGGWPLAVPMLLYVPAGCVAASLWEWGRPAPGEAALAVLLPATAAWLWAFGGWALASSGDSSLGQAGFALLLSTVLLASPSFAFMLLILSGGGDGPFAAPEVWYGGMVLAGLLPPLLFCLGAILPKGRLTSDEIVIK